MSHKRRLDVDVDANANIINKRVYSDSINNNSTAENIIIENKQILAGYIIRLNKQSDYYTLCINRDGDVNVNIESKPVYGFKPLTEDTNSISVTFNYYRIDIICHEDRFFIVQTNDAFDLWQLVTLTTSTDLKLKLNFIRRYENQQYIRYNYDSNRLITYAMGDSNGCDINIYNILNDQLEEKYSNDFGVIVIKDFLIIGNDDKEYDYKICNLTNKHIQFNSMTSNNFKRGWTSKTLGNYLVIIHNEFDPTFGIPLTIESTINDSHDGNDDYDTKSDGCYLLIRVVDPLADKIIHEFYIDAVHYFDGILRNYNGNDVIVVTVKYDYKETIYALKLVDNYPQLCRIDKDLDSIIYFGTNQTEVKVLKRIVDQANIKLPTCIIDIVLDYLVT